MLFLYLVILPFLKHFRIRICVPYPSFLSPPPASCYLLVLQLVMVGDPAQLPATVLSQTAKRQDYHQSLFKRLFKTFTTTTSSSGIVGPDGRVRGSVSDPDPDWIRIQGSFGSGFGNRIRNPDSESGSRSLKKGK